MSIQSWFLALRMRGGLAASLVVLAIGGLVLAKSAHRSGRELPRPEPTPIPGGGNGTNTTTFSGTGLKGRLSLSHTRVLQGVESRIYGELVLRAEPREGRSDSRSPLAIAVVLDTSGSMSGEKIAEAKRSVRRMLSEMRDADQVAVVRYSDTVEVVQPLATLGEVSSSLSSRIGELTAGGGTDIPLGLSRGLGQLEGASKGRVRRVILASDGLDSHRARSEQLARQSAENGITVSSLGIGLDFDESYMAAVARAGRGNFAFVENADKLAEFLQKEVNQTALTTVENLHVELRLPDGVRFIRALGADSRRIGEGVELEVGAIFAGDERRIVVELGASLPDGVERSISGRVAWKTVTGDGATTGIGALALLGSKDLDAVERGRDGAVFASAVSVLASTRQMEAAEAYSRGDVSRAQAIIAENQASLSAAASAAPAPARARLANQASAYAETQKEFANAPAGSPKGRAAAKAAAARDFDNVSRVGY